MIISSFGVGGTTMDCFLQEAKTQYFCEGLNRGLNVPLDIYGYFWIINHVRQLQMSPRLKKKNYECKVALLI